MYNSAQKPDTAVIMVGGFGTRLSEETVNMPKPLVEIGGHPILWHIMKIYSHYGVSKFILCAGYKQQLIKNYFEKLFISESDVEFNTATGEINILKPSRVNWRVSVVDTGLESETGQRLRAVHHLLPDSFFLTYGDGVANIDINKLCESHFKSEKLGTITAVQPSGRFGALDINSGTVEGFIEKPKGDKNWVNGGFMILDKRCIDFMRDGNVPLEDGMLAHLADKGQLSAYKHCDFGQPMDTMRDKKMLNELWGKPDCPWRMWHD